MNYFKVFLISAFVMCHISICDASSSSSSSSSASSSLSAPAAAPVGPQQTFRQKLDDPNMSGLMKLSDDTLNAGLGASGYYSYHKARTLMGDLHKFGDRMPDATLNQIFINGLFQHYVGILTGFNYEYPKYSAPKDIGPYSYNNPNNDKYNPESKLTKAQALDILKQFFGMDQKEKNWMREDGDLQRFFILNFKDKPTSDLTSSLSRINDFYKSGGDYLRADKDLNKLGTDYQRIKIYLEKLEGRAAEDNMFKAIVILDRFNVYQATIIYNWIYDYFKNAKVLYLAELESLKGQNALARSPSNISDIYRFAQLTYYKPEFLKDPFFNKIVSLDTTLFKTKNADTITAAEILEFFDDNFPDGMGSGAAAAPPSGSGAAAPAAPTLLAQAPAPASARAPEPAPTPASARAPEPAPATASAPTPPAPVPAPARAPAPALAPGVIGEWSFANNQNPDKVWFGFSKYDASGIWSSGNSADIDLRDLWQLPKAATEDLDLIIKGHAILNPATNNQQVKFIVNKEDLGTITYNNADERDVVIALPKEVINNPDYKYTIHIKFDFLNSVKNASGGMEAFVLKSLQLRKHVEGAAASASASASAATPPTAAVLPKDLPEGFDPKVYVALNPDLKDYIARYPEDVAAAGGEDQWASKHYITNGKGEGRQYR